MYANGQGVAQDHVEAMRLWQLANGHMWKSAGSNLEVLQRNNAIRQTIPPPLPGTAVIVVGLTSEAGKLLNNRKGTVVIPADGGFPLKPGRVAVLFEAESVPRSFKQMNLHIDRTKPKKEQGVTDPITEMPVRSFESESETIQKRKTLAMKAKLASYLQHVEDAGGGSNGDGSDGGSDGGGDGGGGGEHMCPRCTKHEEDAYLFGRSGLLCCSCGQSYCGACSKDFDACGQSKTDFDKCVVCDTLFPKSDEEVFWLLGQLVLGPGGSKRREERYTAAAQFQIGMMYVAMHTCPRAYHQKKTPYFLSLPLTTKRRAHCTLAYIRT